MSNLILSAFSDEYSDDFASQVKAMKRLGISFIEIRFVDKKNIAVLNDEELLRAKRILEEEGIKVSSVGSPLGKINLNDDFEEHLRLAQRVFGAANLLGAKNVRIFSFYLPEGKTRSDCRDEVLEKLSRLISLADRFGITLCHENEALIYGESPDRCLDLLSYFGGRLKAVFDMGNFVLDGFEPYPDAYEKLLPYIEYFHIKDSLYKGAIVPAGKGEAKIKDILDDYKVRVKKDTFITLEPHLETFSGLNALVGKGFENPYKFSSSEESFEAALFALRSLI